MKQGNKLLLQTSDYAKKKNKKAHRPRDIEEVGKTCGTARMWVVCDSTAYAAVRHYHRYLPRSSSGVEEKYLRQLQ